MSLVFDLSMYKKVNDTKVLYKDIMNHYILLVNSTRTKITQS